MSAPRHRHFHSRTLGVPKPKRNQMRLQIFSTRRGRRNSIDDNSQRSREFDLLLGLAEAQQKEFFGVKVSHVDGPTRSREVHYIVTDTAASICINEQDGKVQAEIRKDRRRDGREKWDVFLTKILSDEKIKPMMEADNLSDALGGCDSSELNGIRMLMRTSKSTPIKVLVEKVTWFWHNSKFSVEQSDLKLKIFKNGEEQRTYLYRGFTVDGQLTGVNIAKIISAVKKVDPQAYVGSLGEFCVQQLHVFGDSGKSSDEQKGPIREYTQPPLPPIDDMDGLINDMRGPTPFSNWVVPEWLLVGAWPGSDYDKQEGACIPVALLENGIDVFVSLVGERSQEYQDEITNLADERYRLEYEESPSPSSSESPSPAVSPQPGPRNEPLPRSAISQTLPTSFAKVLTPVGYKAPFVPYVKKPKRELPPKPVITFLQFDIIDYCRAPNTHDFMAFLDDLVARIRAGHKVYIHCRGGHGRTGMAVAYMLGVMYDLSDEEALKRTQLYHDTREYSNRLRVQAHYESPQTPGQIQQVKTMLEIHRNQKANQNARW